VTRAMWLAAAIAAPFIAIAGLVALIFGTAILEVLCLEVLCLELAALVLILTGAGALVADLTGRDR
jgi:hypothetical protein